MGYVTSPFKDSLPGNKMLHQLVLITHHFTTILSDNSYYSNYNSLQFINHVNALYNMHRFNHYKLCTIFTIIALNKSLPQTCIMAYTVYVIMTYYTLIHMHICCALFHYPWPGYIYILRLFLRVGIPHIYSTHTSSWNFNLFYHKIIHIL